MASSLGFRTGATAAGHAAERSRSTSQGKTSMSNGLRASNTHQRNLAFSAAVSGNQLPSIPKQGTAALKARSQLLQVLSAAQQLEVEVDKPLGLQLGARQGGGVVISAVLPGSNAAKAGLKSGDQVVYTSSFFGDELWPAGDVGLTKTAVNARPESVFFVVARGGDVEVKRLPKRPAPARFGRKLTEAQKARATHICLDCGYIYTLPKSFDDQPEGYQCPQCAAPKQRFALFDPETGKAIGGGSTPLVALLSIVFGLVAIGAAAYFGLQ